MKAKVILHNSVSIDCSYVGITPNLALHYQIVSQLKADVYMIGSISAKSGIEDSGQAIPEETVKDFEKPKKEKSLAYWLIPDSKGSLKGLLHVYRNYEFCKDVILLVSRKTPADYLEYLDKRNYDYIMAGDIRVDYKKAFEALSAKYNIASILVDSGSTLVNILLNKHLVDQINLLISPEIIGEPSKNLFTGLNSKIKLKCTHCERLADDYIWISYELLK